MLGFFLGCVCLAGTIAAMSNMATNCFVVSLTHPSPRELHVQCDTAARCNAWIEDINDIVSEAYLSRPMRRPPGISVSAEIFPVMQPGV